MEIHEVVKTYREGDAVTHVLSGVSLDLNRGETTSLIGPSGSGKSTLLALIAGLAPPDSGTVVFDGGDIAELGDSGRARLRSSRIGVVLQTGNLIPFLTAQENVELAIDLSGRRRNGAASDLLAEVGLAGRLDHLPARLSGGEVQRVSVAMALARQPDLLLADEATGELDSHTADQLMEIVFASSRARGLTVLYVTHDRDLAACAEHRLRLSDGRLGRA